MKDLDSIENKEKIVLLRNEKKSVDIALENQPIRLKEIAAQDKLNLNKLPNDYIIRNDSGSEQNNASEKKTGSHNLTQLHNFRTHHK